MQSKVDTLNAPNIEYNMTIKQSNLAPDSELLSTNKLASDHKQVGANIKYEDQKKNIEIEDKGQQQLNSDQTSKIDNKSSSNIS